jgi:hypothetical protein
MKIIKMIDTGEVRRVSNGEAMKLVEKNRVAKYVPKQMAKGKKK